MQSGTTKAIFCDVDGVLNNANTAERSPNGYVGVSDQLIRNLRKIVTASGACIVLSSDWRLVRDETERGKDYRYLVRRLRFAGNLKITDHTPDISWRSRGLEIRRFLEEHPRITDFVILDDLPFRDFLKYDLLGNLVLTDPKHGLTDTDVERAVCILNGEKVEPCDSGLFTGW